jgi:hypothetical protein
MGIAPDLYNMLMAWDGRYKWIFASRSEFKRDAL